MFLPARIFFHRCSAALPFATVAAVLVTGCANPGPPRPPSLHLPALATGVKAERVGGQVLLTWTTPDKTSDGLLYRDPIVAVVCRDEGGGGKKPAGAPDCSAVSRVTVTAGESHASDTLPPALTQDPVRLLVYRIELMNGKNRSAGVSAPAFAGAGAAPADPGAIRVSASRKGVVVEWAAQASGTEAVMEVSRMLTADAQGPVVAKAPPSGPPKKSLAGSPMGGKKDVGAPVLLEAPEGTHGDMGGLLDAGAVPHDTYVYTAQRVRTVTLGGHALELRSAPSPAARFEYGEVFPPRAPTGLESVASAPVAGSASIDLSWDANLEAGLLGYNVYRSEASSGEFSRLNPTPIPGPAFRDMTALAGHSYRYRVTAVDRSGNESPASEEIEEGIRRP